VQVQLEKDVSPHGVHDRADAGTRLADCSGAN
jgi:hypothetical protein